MWKQQIPLPPQNVLPWVHPEPAEKFPYSTWKGVRGGKLVRGGGKEKFGSRGDTKYLTVFGRVALHEDEAQDDGEEAQLGCLVVPVAGRAASPT